MNMFRLRSLFSADEVAMLWVIRNRFGSRFLFPIIVVKGNWSALMIYGWREYAELRHFTFDSRTHRLMQNHNLHVSNHGASFNNLIQLKNMLEKIKKAQLRTE